jgi:hypothetical protein
MVKSTKPTSCVFIVSGGIITRGYCVLGMCKDNVDAELEKYKKYYGDCKLTCAFDASAETHFDDIKKKVKEFIVDDNDCLYHLQISNFKEEVKAITGVTKFNMLPKKGSSTDDDKPKKAVAKKDTKKDAKKKDAKEKAPAKGKKAKDEKDEADDSKKDTKEKASTKKAPAKKAPAKKDSKDEKKKPKEESEDEDEEEEESDEESEDESDSESEEEEDDE